VDLDKKMLDLGKSHPIFKTLNNNALNHVKVNTVVDDAFTFFFIRYLCIVSRFLIYYGNKSLVG